MLEKKKWFGRRLGTLLLLLFLSVSNGIIASAVTRAGTTFDIKYIFVGNVIQSGMNLRTTGSTQANISLKKKTNYVLVEASKEYINSKGKKAVSTVKSCKLQAKSITKDVIQNKKISLGTVYIPKTISGKSVIARVAHSFSSGNVSSFAHTVY